MPSFTALTRLRRRPDEVCAGCGLALTAQLVVRDIDSNGDLADYHQSCAPSMSQGIAAQRLGTDRSVS